jgi:hypothetical protein
MDESSAVRPQQYRTPLRSSRDRRVQVPITVQRHGRRLVAHEGLQDFDVGAARDRQRGGGVTQRMRCHSRKLGCDGLPGLVYFLSALCAGRRLNRPEGRVERPPQFTQRHPAPMPRRKHQILAVAASQLCREQRCKKPRDWDRDAVLSGRRRTRGDRRGRRNTGLIRYLYNRQRRKDEAALRFVAAVRPQ